SSCRAFSILAERWPKSKTSQDRVSAALLWLIPCPSLTVRPVVSRASRPGSLGDADQRCLRPGGGPDFAGLRIVAKGEIDGIDGGQWRGGNLGGTGRF